MGLWTWLFLFVVSVYVVLARNVEEGYLVINGSIPMTHTDANYICATIDWWPSNKCNYRQCPWGASSALNLDLSHPFLAKAVQAFRRLRIRVGGSLQDQVLYNVGGFSGPCSPFTKKKGGLFGFSKGCLPMSRWDELNHFFNKTRALVTFGLNALNGRHLIKRGVWGGDWNSTNARDFIKYTVSKGYQIDSWEFGNELSGKGIGAMVNADQYGSDVIELREIIDNSYRRFRPKPLLVAPGGFFDKQWFTKLLKVSGSEIVNVMTHHMYNLGPGVDPNLVKKILDPRFLNRASVTFNDLRQTIQTDGPWTSAWIGESGGAYNSGGLHVSDSFVDSFWYLDQLGMAAKYHTKVYCRQTLIGGNYGLLNKTTFMPNPDYYSALLWNRLMGTGVLAVDRRNIAPHLRTYAHCSKGKTGITLLLINLSNQTHFRLNVRNILNIRNLHTTQHETSKKKTSFVHGLKTTVSWVGTKSTDENLSREEYHLTPLHGDIRSKTMVLNGIPLKLTVNGDIPILRPALVKVNYPVSIAPLSIKFLQFPNFDAPGCE
ncbi:Glycoside hydrolase, family 79 [Artemisia annua]|uniref:Glycoside hydrolase, family 79 n=1 Tax=Artemisia annua TaxID=35608 RepID=A0A2U1P842_ARTAN|nr:Glycoside hydrolase, family 79 [Artemisia annua]